MSETTANFDVETLLDSSLDDLVDLPEFVVFPEGAHRVTVEFCRKVINKHPSVELKLKLIETVEAADPSAPTLAAGTESSVAYMLDNEFGQGKLKAVLKPLAEHLGLTKTGDVLGAATGTECLVVTKQRTNKEKTATYLDVVSLQVL